MKRNRLFIKLFTLASAFMLVACGTGGATNKNSYTVTFDLNGAPGSNSTLVVEEGSVVTSKNINKESDGYYFVSWCLDEAGNNPYDFNSTINGDLTLYASWNFHVYFLDSLGQRSAIEQDYLTVKRGGKLTEEPVCLETSSGKVFDGWYSGENKFNLNDPINEPDLTYIARFSSIERVFKFYIGDELIKTSTAGVNRSWVELPTFDESFAGHEGFKGWYDESGTRFDFDGFDVNIHNYMVKETILHAEFEDLKSKKELTDFVSAYKYHSYGAQINEGIGIFEGTYRLSLSSTNSKHYGVALYPTIFYGNLYSAAHCFEIKFGEFSSNAVSVQPRVYVLKNNGDRESELYTRSGKANSSGKYRFVLNDLFEGGNVDYVWSGDRYFQFGFEYEQPESMLESGSIEIESINLTVFDNSVVNLNQNFDFDLPSFWGGKCDNCSPEYMEDTHLLRLINTGDAHYGAYTYYRKFNASVGGQYKMQVNIANFSPKSIPNEQRLEVFMEIVGGAVLHIGSVKTTGLAVLDFSDKVSGNVTFAIRINVVFANDCIDKVGYYTNEYIELSSLSIAVSAPETYTNKVMNLEEMFSGAGNENGISGSYHDGKYTISSSTGVTYYGTILPTTTWTISEFEKGGINITISEITGSCKMYVQVACGGVTYYLDQQPSTVGEHTLAFADILGGPITGPQIFTFKFGIEDLNHETPNASYTISKIELTVA